MQPFFLALVFCRSESALEEVLHKLPLRRQQVFLLRIREGMSINETAAAMACALGSVPIVTGP